MNPLKISCPTCRNNISVEPAQCGTSANCPHCGNPLLVPPYEYLAAAATQGSPVPAGKVSAPSTPQFETQLPSPPSPVNPVPPAREPTPPISPANRSGGGSLKSVNFARHKSQFLEGDTLERWESSALKAFQQLKLINVNLNLVLILLVLNILFRFFLLSQSNSRMGGSTFLSIEIGGLFLVMIMAVITKVLPNLFTVITLGVLILVFALGIITGLVAISLFCSTPLLAEMGRQVKLTASDRKFIASRLKKITNGRDPYFWSVGKLFKTPVWTRRFDNGAIFLTKDHVLNVIEGGDLGRIVLTKDKKGNPLIKQWPVRTGNKCKLRSVKITLKHEAYEELMNW